MVKKIGKIKFLRMVYISESIKKIGLKLLRLKALIRLVSTNAASNIYNFIHTVSETFDA